MSKRKKLIGVSVSLVFIILGLSLYFKSNFPPKFDDKVVKISRVKQEITPDGMNYTISVTNNGTYILKRNALFFRARSYILPVEAKVTQGDKELIKPGENVMFTVFVPKDQFSDLQLSKILSSEVMLKGNVSWWFWNIPFNKGGSVDINHPSLDTGVSSGKGDVVSTTHAKSGSDTEFSSLKRQIDMLQFAFQPQSANDAAETWARGVKTRNAALQFAVLSPDLQTKSRKDFDLSNWVTGVSSPWVTNFNIKNTGSSGNSVTYEINFNMATSTGPAGEVQVKVTVQQDNSTWYITNVTTDTKMFNLNLS